MATYLLPVKKNWRHIWATRVRFLIEHKILAITRCLGQFFAQSFTAHAQKRPFSTFDQIFNWKFEIFVARFLFDYEIWCHLRQDLCMFGAKNSIRNAKFPKFGGSGGDTHFCSRPPKVHPRQIPRVLSHWSSSSVGGFCRDARVRKRKGIKSHRVVM